MQQDDAYRGWRTLRLRAAIPLLVVALSLLVACIDAHGKSLGARCK